MFLSGGSNNMLGVTIKVGDVSMSGIASATAIYLFIYI